MKKVVNVEIHAASGCWVIKFPDVEVTARDRTMVAKLIKTYEREHNVIAAWEWK